MSLLRPGLARHIIVAYAAILGLLVHMAWDAVPAIALDTGNSGRTLTAQQKHFFTALRKARARDLMAGIRTPVSVDEFSTKYQGDLASNDSLNEDMGLPGSDKNSNDQTADDCPGCLRDHGLQKGLISAPRFTHFSRAIYQIVYLPQISDPKWLNSYILFNSRAPPRHA